MGRLFGCQAKKTAIFKIGKLPLVFRVHLLLRTGSQSLPLDLMPDVTVPAGT